MKIQYSAFPIFWWTHNCPSNILYLFSLVKQNSNFVTISSDEHVLYIYSSFITRTVLYLSMIRNHSYNVLYTVTTAKTVIINIYGNKWNKKYESVEYTKPKTTGTESHESHSNCV